MKAQRHKRLFSKILLIIGCILLGALAVWFHSQGWLKNPAPLQKLLDRAGPFGWLLFVFLQAFQVVVPILPGGVSGTIGMLCFGVWKGFFLSYIGVLIGSAISFLLVRKYGRRLLLCFVSQKNYDKYTAWLKDDKKFKKLFACGIFMPVAPDDVLCMVAGLSNLSFVTFFLILVAGKPISMFIYSYGLKWILSLMP